MDIVVWLRSLGLGKYEAAFRENEIDETVLPSLTHENLKELGVASLGHRVKLLDAIAALRSDASGKTPSVDAATTSSAPSAHPEDRAERRQVTVMFSDLVGSTALSARMDPEDLREVISAYQKCVAETVQRFGGFVAKYMGDGVLIYFGYPQAHEDDAERAVRAGLELVAAVGALKTHAPLQTRVGIATGLVVVGDLIGSGASQEQAIVGETPNLAARLQGVAEPNSVVIAESTRKLVGNLFELEDLGAQDLKGIAGPVQSLGRTATSFRREPLRGSPRKRADRACRARRRTRTAAAALVEGEDRRRSSGVALWRTGHRQVSTDGCAAGTPRSRATHALALFLLAAAHRQRACIRSSARWSAPLDSRTTTHRKRSSTSSMRCWRRASTSTPGRRTSCRNAVAAERWTLSNARTDTAATAAAENAGSAHCASRGAVAPKSSADDLRGRALDRPNEPGSARSDRGPDTRPFACC